MGRNTFAEWNIPVALQMYWKPVLVMIYDAKVVSEMIISVSSSGEEGICEGSGESSRK